MVRSGAASFDCVVLSTALGAHRYDLTTPTHKDTSSWNPRQPSPDLKHHSPCHHFGLIVHFGLVLHQGHMVLGHYAGLLSADIAP